MQEGSGPSHGQLAAHPISVSAINDPESNHVKHISNNGRCYFLSCEL